MTGPAFNSIGWFEIGTDRPEKVKDFYGELFGWTFELNTNLPGVRYHEVSTATGQQSSGGVFESAGNFPDYAIFYVLVQDVAKTLDRAKNLGAEVVMEPVTDAAGITFGRLRDSSGHHFGVFSPPAN
jgi:predicted enzyme related to lactoylglutathione lyase